MPNNFDKDILYTDFFSKTEREFLIVFYEQITETNPVSLFH